MKTLLFALAPKVRDAFANAIRRQGHDVTAAGDVDSLLAACQDQQHSVVLLGVDLPNEGGPALCRRIATLSAERSYAILAMTERRDPEHLRRLLDTGADDYVILPIDPDLVAVRVEALRRRVRAVWPCLFGTTGPSRRPLEECTLARDVLGGAFCCTPDGQLLEVSRPLVDMLGYESVEELLGVDLLHDVCEDPKALARLLADPRDYVWGEKQVWIRKDGTPLTVRLSGSAVRDPQGRLLRFQAVVEDVTEQQRAEEALRKERQVLRQLLDMHERDRRLMAYEIHDGFAQQATAALFDLENFRQLYSKDSKEAWKHYDMAMKRVKESIDEARRLIGGLRPPVLDEFGVVAAVQFIVSETQKREGVRIEFSDDVQFTRLAPPLESAAFRIVQECLTNACRHSQSETIRVELTQKGDRLQIKVRDWGVGFDTTQVDPTRFGLEGIRERARLLGGTATIDSAPNRGTRVVVELPVVEEVPDDPPNLTLAEATTAKC